MAGRDGTKRPSAALTDDSTQHAYETERAERNAAGQKAGPRVSRASLVPELSDRLTRYLVGLPVSRYQEHRHPDGKADNTEAYQADPLPCAHRRSPRSERDPVADLRVTGSSAAPSSGSQAITMRPP